MARSSLRRICARLVRAVTNLMVEIEEFEEVRAPSPGRVELEEMTATQLKKLLKEKNISAAGCREKQDLVERVLHPGDHQHDGAASSSTATAAAPAAAADTTGARVPPGALAMMPMMWLSGKIDFADEFNLNLLRSIFAVVVVLSGATLYFTLLKVKAAKGNERRVKGPGQSQFYTIKEEDDTVSVGEYDAGKVKETLLQLGLGVCVMCVMHFKWGYVQPLMIHCLLQPSQVWDCKAVQVHLRGKEAEHPRPWKIGGGSPIEAWAQRKKEEMEAAAKEAKAEEAKKSD